MLQAKFIEKTTEKQRRFCCYSIGPLFGVILFLSIYLALLRPEVAYRAVFATAECKIMDKFLVELEKRCTPSEDPKLKLCYAYEPNVKVEFIAPVYDCEAIKNGTWITLYNGSCLVTATAKRGKSDNIFDTKELALEWLSQFQINSTYACLRGKGNITEVVMSLEFDPAFNLVWSLAIALPIFFCIVPPLLIKELRMFTREREDIENIENSENT